MARFSVETEALAGAATVLERSLAALSAASAAVAATSDAAVQTPADGACAQAASAGARTTDEMHETCVRLSGAVTRAARNYAEADSASTVCPAPGR